MLALTRNANESVVLSSPEWKEPITINVVDINPVARRVKLGIQAPQSVLIVRKELLEKAEARQGECQELPTKNWYVADRAKAKKSAGPRGRAYIEVLEKIAILSDVFWVFMNSRAMSPEEDELSNDLLDALSAVNFLAECDQANEDVVEEELPREVVFR